MRAHRFKGEDHPEGPALRDHPDGLRRSPGENGEPGATDAPEEPEERVVERYALLDPTPAERAERKELARRLGPAEWARAMERARSQGVAPLMFAAVAGDGDLPLLPATVAEGLRESYCATLVRNRRMQTVETHLLRRLVARGIPVMALKGLALALRAYGELALRPTTDIDLLVPRGRVAEVRAILVGMGYHPSSGSGKPSGFNAQTHAVVDYLRANSPQVEIHWELFNHSAYRAGLPAASAWARADRTTLFGQPVVSLAPADELRYLSVHYAAEHHLSKLIWGVDLVQLVGRLPSSWDWDAFARETIQSRMARPVAMALADCRRRLSLRLPPGVLGRLAEAAESDAERAVWAASQSRPFTAPWIRAHAAALRGPVEWAVFARGLLAPRTPALAELYGPEAAIWPRRAVVHLRHAGRLAPELLAAVRAGEPPPAGPAQGSGPVWEGRPDG